MTITTLSETKQQIGAVTVVFTFGRLKVKPEDIKKLPQPQENREMR